MDKNAKEQAKFYDTHPPLVPWPDVLKEYGFSVTYKPREVFWKRYFDRELKRGQKVLDVGCGQGLMLSRLKTTYGINGVGIDVSKKSISYAKKNYLNKDLEYKVADATKIPYKDKSFDVVVSFDALEHIDDQKKTVTEMVRVLKPGGKLIIYTMSKDYEFTLDWVWEKMGFDIMRRAAHIKELFVDPAWLKQAVERGGCNIESFEYFDAFFTLGFDESVMVDNLISRKLGFFKHRGLGKIVIKYYHLLSKSLFPLLNFLDNLWYRVGKSISFIVVSEKK